MISYGGGQHLFQERREIFRFIKKNREIFPVEKMCKVLKVSVSGYYYWLKHPVSSRTVKEQALLVDIHRVYEDSKKRYGSPRIASELKQLGIWASRPRVARWTRCSHRLLVNEESRYQKYYQKEVPGADY